MLNLSSIKYVKQEDIIIIIMRAGAWERGGRGGERGGREGEGGAEGEEEDDDE